MGRIEVKYDPQLRKRFVCKYSSDPDKEYHRLISFDSPRIIRPAGVRNGYLLFPEYIERAADGIAGYCSEREAWRFIRDVSEGLDYLHRRGILHLDIQPANILISEQGYVIGDFDGEGDKSSYAFTPPEWHRDRNLLEPASDVWSLGASVFYLINGAYIFSGRGGAAQRQETLIPRLSERYSAELSEIVASSLSYEPAARPLLNDIYMLAKKMAEVEDVRMEKMPKQHVPDIISAYDRLWPEKMEK